MPEVTQHYDNLAERQDIVVHWEALGYRMLHDDFDPDWKSGDEPHGTTTFTNEPEPITITPEVRNLEADLGKLIARVEKLEKKVK